MKYTLNLRIFALETKFSCEVARSILPIQLLLTIEAIDTQFCSVCSALTVRNKKLNG